MGEFTNFLSNSPQFVGSFDLLALKFDIETQNSKSPQDFGEFDLPAL